MEYLGREAGLVTGTRMRRFVLLDRDGTINVEREYLADPAGVALLPNAAEGLARMKSFGLGLAVISNQSGIGRGYFSLDDVAAVNRRLMQLLAASGVVLDGIFVCPHAPDAGCACRKPAPGLVRDAARALRFDPAQAFLIGDKTIDIATGMNVGATTLLVRTGYGRDVEAAGGAGADHVADDLLAAAAIVERALAATEPAHARS